MGKNSKIEWCHHTFNSWRGCTKVSPGCKNCYAEAGSKRNPGVLGVWGPDGTRVVAAASKWHEPLAWDKAAAAAGERHRVFCASLADVFEDWTGPIVNSRGDRLFNYVDVNASAVDGSIGATVDNARAKLFRLIRQTPHLDWLLLTKRPENVVPILRRLGDLFEPSSDDRKAITRWMHFQAPPANLWLGVSVEDRKHGLPRVDRLRALPAAVRFLSVEPLLEDLGDLDLAGIDWVIVGGESGPGARPMNSRWVINIRDRCRAANVAFFFKQHGEWAPIGPSTGLTLEQASGPRHWFENEGGVIVHRVGKKAAGRLLDGRTWDELPTPREVATS